MSESFKFTSSVTRYPGAGGWHFVELDKQLSKDVKIIAGGETVGFGYVRIEATIGDTSWQTTLFPSKEKIYLMAIKEPIRKKENIKENDLVSVSFTLL